MAISKNAKTVLERRYLKDGETPEEMFKRVATYIAKTEDEKQVFYNMMLSNVFLPNSPTLMNAGRELGQLAACFVLPVNDSLVEIFDTIKNTAIIHKSGGGTGFNFSNLRPKDSMVGSTGGVASGPVSFMKIFNAATEQVKQGGTRRGANMAILRVDHPDIMEFITCKTGNENLNNFNISVAITDSFMQAVNADEDYQLINPKDNKGEAWLSAKAVYTALIKNAWANGDPGVIFLDKINQDNPTPALGDMESTNPCGEQPLLPYEACNLGSINLAKMITEDNHIDYGALDFVVRDAVNFLDNAIDVARYPLPEIDKMVKNNRKIGLGIMGFADMLYQLGIPYNSAAALDIATEIMGFINQKAHNMSIDLGVIRGPFPNAKDSNVKTQRNATLTTIAPTGTLSIIADCSSGIEPLFALSFVRRVLDNDELLEVNPYFEKIAKEKDFYSEELMNTIAKTGSIQGLKDVPEDIQKIFVTAHDISPEWHIRMQAAFQKYTDNAVSKTVNLPHDATEQDVRNIYDMAYNLGCKGVTIYRDGSKNMQVLSVAGNDIGSKPEHMSDRPDMLEGFTSKIKTGMGNLYVTVSEHEGRPFEVFATVGRSGKSITAKTEAIGRLVSLALRNGIDVEKIIKQLGGICGEHPVFSEGGMVLSIPDAISKILSRRYSADNLTTKEICPDCGGVAICEEGCMKCHSCGYSKC